MIFDVTNSCQEQQFEKKVVQNDNAQKQKRVWGQFEKRSQRLQILLSVNYQLQIDKFRICFDFWSFYICVPNPAVLS